MDPWVSFLSEEAERIFSDKVIQDGEENMQEKDFPGGLGVKNLPASTGDMGLILIRGKEPTCHRATEPACQNYSAGARAHAPLQQSPNATVTEAHAPACALQQEEPAHCN